MNINDEKKYIYAMMKDITEERRKLTDIYYGLKKRLDELNSLELRGLEDLSISGYVDLFNKTKKSQSIANIEREVGKIIKDINESDAPVKKEIIPKQEIEEQKEKDINNSKFKPKTLNIDKAVGAISSILKESEVPLSIKDLHSKLENNLEMEIKISNFRNNILPRACKQNNKIQRASRGYYQYVN